MLDQMKRLHWYDWFIFGVRVCWCVSIIALLWEVEEMWSYPFWINVSLTIIATSVPFLALQFNRQLYIVTELLLSGTVLYLMDKAPSGAHLFFLPISFMIGYYSRGYVFLWSAPLTAVVFPIWISWHTHDTWENILFGIIFNYCIIYGLGYAFQVLIVSHKQSRIIEEQNKILEQSIKQVEKVTLLEERNRLSRELHDTIGHMLTSMIMGMESLRASMPPETGTVKTKLETLLALAREGFEDIRRHIHDMKTDHSEMPLPLLLEDVVRTFSHQTGVEALLKQSGDPYPIDRKGRLTFMRCLQEALTNAVRHGQADCVIVNLNFDKDQITLQIEDNGNGQEDLQPGFGLSGMKERLEELKGMLQIRSHPATGTSVICTLPYRVLGTKEVIHVVIVDDQPIVLEGLKTLLEYETDLRVAATAENGVEAVAVCGQMRPDLVLMDFHMPVMDGITALQKIKQDLPGIKVLMMSTFEELDLALKSFKNGADGYLLKSAHPQELVETVRLVHSGGTAINRDIAAKMIEGFDRAPSFAGVDSAISDDYLFGLTKREMEILQYLDTGLRYKSLAAKLFLSEGTIRNYISSIYGKLGVSNREDAVEKARAEGLMSD